MKDGEIAPYLNKACVVDLDIGPLSGVLVRLNGRYRMRNELGPIENPALVIQFRAEQVVKIRPLE